MEEEIEQFTKENNIDVIILRIFNIYGVGQTPEYAGVITKFLEKISENNPLEIFGDGLQTRDFVSVNDVVNSMYNAIQYGKNETFNIATGKAITIKELAEKMIAMSGKKIDIKYLERKKGEIRHSYADISKAKEMIGYSPKFDLDKIKELF